MNELAQPCKSFVFNGLTALARSMQKSIPAWHAAHEGARKSLAVNTLQEVGRMANIRFREPTAREKRSSVPLAGQTKAERSGRADHADGAPMVDIDLKGALTDAPTRRENSARLLQASEDERGTFVDVRLYLDTPSVSASGKSFACGWGTTEAGSVKVNAMAYIPIPKEDRWRYRHLAEAAAAAKASKARGGDDSE